MFLKGFLMRKVVIAAASLGFATVGVAQTYSVEPGLWKIEGQGLLAGVGLPIDQTECVSPEDAKLDVSEALARMGNTSCAFDHGNGRDFSLSCVGDVTFSASGSLQVNRRQVEVNAIGTVVMDGAGELPASIKATVKHIGSCPAP
jgi:hypothetical protein